MAFSPLVFAEWNLSEQTGDRNVEAEGSQRPAGTGNCD